MLSAFGWLALAELLVGAVLLGRLVYDLGKLHVAIAACVGAFYVGFLVVGAANVRALVRGGPPAPALGRSARLGLAIAVPVALLASTLDCMGLDFDGCTPLCGFLKRAVAPAVAVLVVIHAVTTGPAWLLAATACVLALLAPNCVCGNPVNRYWIGLLGRSPACYASAFAVILLATTALGGGRLVRPALLCIWGVVAAQLAFWIGHHYFHVPW